MLGIRDARTLQAHAARGALFETWVVTGGTLASDWTTGRDERQGGEELGWREFAGIT